MSFTKKDGVKMISLLVSVSENYKGIGHDVINKVYKLAKNSDELIAQSISNYVDYQDILELYIHPEHFSQYINFMNDTAYDSMGYQQFREIAQLVIEDMDLIHDQLAAHNCPRQMEQDARDMEFLTGARW